MFSRKLAALQFPRSSDFDSSSDEQFKNLIVWLEDQKIRHYKIEDRIKLKDIESGVWSEALTKYLQDVCCPFTNRNACIDWLLGYAIRLEYGDNVKKYQQVNGTKPVSQQNAKQTSTIQNISENDPKFKAGVRNFAKTLNIPLHEDDKVTLQAILLLVEERLSEKGLQNMKDQVETKSIPLQQLPLGFDAGDEVLNNAARGLRLLHINELRQLQTDINNAIVSVQTLTAHPKTDLRLGKVGRS